MNKFSSFFKNLFSVPKPIVNFFSRKPNIPTKIPPVAAKSSVPFSNAINFSQKNSQITPADQAARVAAKSTRLLTKQPINFNPQAQEVYNEGLKTAELLKNQNSENPFDALPPEALQHVFNFIPNTTLRKIATVDTRLAQNANDVRVRNENQKPELVLAKKLFKQGFEGKFFIGEHAIRLPKKLTVNSFIPNVPTKIASETIIVHLDSFNTPLEKISYLQRKMNLLLNDHVNTRFCSILREIQLSLINPFKVEDFISNIEELNTNEKKAEVKNPLLDIFYYKLQELVPTKEHKLNYLEFKITKLSSCSSYVSDLLTDLKSRTDLTAGQSNKIQCLNRVFTELKRQQEIAAYTSVGFY